MTSKLSTRGAVARSAGVLGALTFLSRVLGFIRDVLMARLFGTGAAAEAFVVSFKLPNLFRDIVGEGAMNSAIVPVLSEVHAKKGEEEFARVASALFFWATAVLLALSVAGVVFAPVVVRFAAPGFVKDPAKFELTVGLTRLLFPFIGLVGFSALLMGVLNSMRSFASSAIGSSILNLCMIASIFLLTPFWGVRGLAAGVLIGGVLQCVVQLVSFRGKNFRYSRGVHFTPEIARILKLLGPRVWGTAVYQISVFIDTIIASFYWIVGGGGQSALYYASRLFQLPLSLFGVSFAQASLPTLAAHYAKGETDAFKESTLFALRNIFFMTVPASVGLAVFSDAIVSILFKRGAFDAYSVSVTRDALFYYAFGLVSCGAIKILATAFYAIQDTRSPVKAATAALAANVLLNFVLMWHLKIGGLALATSLSTTLNAVILYSSLSRRIGAMDERALCETIFKAVFSGMAMGCFGAFLMRPWIRTALDAGHTTGAVVRLAVSIAACVAVYVAASMAVHSPETAALKRTVAARFGRGPAA